MEQLKNWLNNEIKLSKKIDNISDDFQNGYLFAELLYKHKIIPDISIYTNSKLEKDIIHNFCYLSKTFLDMNIVLDEINRNKIIQKSPYTAQVYLYKIKQYIDKKLITFESLKLKQSNSIHKLYTSLMYKNNNEKYLKSRNDKMESEGKKSNNKTEERLKNIRNRFRRLKFSESEYKLIENNVKDLEIYDEAHKKIFSLEKNRNDKLLNLENEHLLKWNKSMAGIREDKKKEKEQFVKKVLYYSKATLNYFNNSSKKTISEINNFEDTIARLGLNIPEDPKKIKASQKINTDILMMKLREKLNEKMKQKKDKEKRDRKRLKEELEMKKILESQNHMNSMINYMNKKNRHKKSKSTLLSQNKRYDEIEKLMNKEDNIISYNDKSENEEDEKDENKNNDNNNDNNNENNEKNETKSSFNHISDSSKGMNLIKNSFSIHNNNITVGNRISLFQTLIQNNNEEFEKDNLIKEKNVITNNITESIDNSIFNKDDFFKELNKMNSTALTKIIEEKKQKKKKHSDLISPIIDQIFDIVNEVKKYQTENHIDLIDNEKWDDLTSKLINKQIIDSSIILNNEKKNIESDYESDYNEKLNEKDEDELFNYCNYIGIFNDNIIPNDIKGYKYNYPDLYNGIYKNENGIDIKDYEPIPDEIENLILPNEKILNIQFGQIIDISLDNRFKDNNKTGINFLEHTVIPISKNALYNYIPIKISFMGCPLSGKKTQIKFLCEKFPYLKFYNLENILFDFVKEYDELNIPIDEHPKVKSAKKNQVENVKMEIEKQKEEFKEIENIIQPYLDLLNIEIEKVKKENESNRIIENNNENDNKDKKNKNKKDKKQNENKENEDNINKEEIMKKIEIPDKVLLNLFIYQINKDFPNDIYSRLNFITDLNNKYIKYQDLQSNIKSIKNQIQEEEEKENEESSKKKKPSPIITNLKKELDSLEKELEKLKPELYIGFIIINYPRTISQANQLENYVTGYISEFDKPLDEKEIKLFSYSNIIDIPIKKNSNHELIHSSIDIIFNLSVEKDEILRRFNGLRYDPKENKLYHIEDNPPNQNDKKLIERIINDIPNLSNEEFLEKKDFYERNINGLYNFYNIMGNGKLKTFNNIDENDKELLKKINDEIEIITEEVCDNFYNHIEDLKISIEKEKEEEEERRKKEEEEKRKKEEEEEEKRKKEEEEEEKKKKNIEKDEEEEEENESDDFDKFNQSQFNNNNDISVELEDEKLENKIDDNLSNLEINPVSELKISMRTGPNYNMIICEIDDLNNEYNKTLKNFIHFISRQENHIIKHLNEHQHLFIQFLNRKTNKKKIAQVYLNKYNELIKNHPEFKNNPNFYRELLNDISIINTQLWNVIQLKKTEDVEKLQSLINDGYKEKEIDFFYKFVLNIFFAEAKKYLTSINVIKQYYLYSSSPDEMEDFYVDYKQIIQKEIISNDNIIHKINNLFTNSLIMIIIQDEKIKKITDDYKDKMLNNNPYIQTGNLKFVNRKNTGISSQSFHSHRSGKTSKSRMKKKSKNVNLLNNTFNIIEEEFKNQIKNEKNKYKYRLLLLKYYSIKYIKNIYKVFDDTYSNLDEFIIDSVKKQNVVLNQFIDYLKSSLNKFLNYITSLEFEFDSFDIYNKYKLHVEDYFTNIKEEEDKKIELKKYNFSIIDLYSLYNIIKEYSSESINYYVKSNIVKEILIKQYFIENPSNKNNKAINEKIRELNYENYHFFIDLFEEFDGKFININELFTTLIIIGSNTITIDKWKELITENILHKEDFMKIEFWFENDAYLNNIINEEEEKVIKEKGEEFKKIDLVKETIFEINQEDDKIDMRKLERMFKIINGEEIKVKKDTNKIKNEEENKEKEEIDNKIEKQNNNEELNDEEFNNEYEECENEENEGKNNKKNENINDDIIKEDEEDDFKNSSFEEEEEDENENTELINKNNNKKILDNKSLIFNLVFKINQ